METKKILTILVLALGLMVCAAKVSEAAPMGTAFTYQGRLLDANSPAEGIYDAIFVLMDSPEGPNELGVTEIQNFEAFDGYFTVELDFGSNAFDGSERWLQVYVRPGDFNDPCEHTILLPRQKITPTPYAIYAKTAGSGGGADSDWIISGNDMYSGVSGNVGIGATSPGHKLHLASSSSSWGMMGLENTNPGDNEVTISFKDGSDASGTDIWLVGVGPWGHKNDFVIARAGVPSNFLIEETGNVGIGTTDPGAKLDVNGSIKSQINTAGYAGQFETSGSLGAAVYCNTTGDLSFGGLFTASGNYSYGIQVEGPPAGKHGCAARFHGNVEVRNRAGDTVLIELGEGLDYAEGFDVSEKKQIGPGSVLIIDVENPGKLAVSNKAYDSKVAGIVAGAKDQGSGVRLGAGQFDYDVALAGRVYCNVDATYGEVSPGDLLTTSPTPCYAMKAVDYMRAQGAILGKAMQKLEKGKKGQILVLVTLQ